MTNITLIATVHKERGNCNSIELLKIIEKIAPDVIFEEHCPNEFSKIYGGLRTDSLETSAIKLYKQNHSVIHYPVDLDGNDLIDIPLKNDITEMFRIFANVPQYDELENHRTYLTARNGFRYLNSNQFNELSELKSAYENKILARINQEKWFQIYNRLLNINDLRETEMIKNIYNYCNEGKFNQALFLIGAGHRNSIMDKISKLETKNKPNLKWNFNYLD